MKRIATATLAATMSLPVLVSPAYAAEAGDDGRKEVSSSEVYKQCREIASTSDEKYLTKWKENSGPSTPDGMCIYSMLRTKEFRGNTIALLTLVPLALVGLIGAGAAYAGLIPGVSIPGAPAVPEIPKLPM